jgi:uncharacterized protein (TIGR01777 family)
MNNKILITGASGLIGKRLTEMLLEKGYQVAHLSRSKKSAPVPSFVWDVDAGEIDITALEGISTIIHLAGAGVADKRWSHSRKEEILQSRVKSTQLLFNTLLNNPNQVKSFISASAIGYYGFGTSDEVFHEQSQFGSDFLANVTREWEEDVDKISSLRMRVAKLRIGIVLSDKGGALVEMAKPIRLGFGSPLGSGKQYLSWIHLDDLCAMFIKAVETDLMQGAYNAVSGNWVTNKEMTKTIAKILNKPLWLPNVPAFVLKLVVGQMAEIVLNGSKVSADKIKSTGFNFKYTDLDQALESLLR